MTRRFPGSAAVTALAITAACSSAPSAPPPASTSTAPISGTVVSIDDFAFAPAALTVHRGETVTWINRDEEPHTVAAGNGSFHSPGMDTNATYSFTFTKPGRYEYICSIHPTMHGTVVVTS